MNCHAIHLKLYYNMMTCSQPGTMPRHHGAHTHVFQHYHRTAHVFSMIKYLHIAIRHQGTVYHLFNRLVNCIEDPFWSPLPVFSESQFLAKHVPKIACPKSMVQGSPTRGTYKHYGTRQKTLWRAHTHSLQSHDHLPNGR